MWSHRRAPVTRRAAAFCTDCRRRSSPNQRGSWQDFNRHDASRGPPAIAEILVTVYAALKRLWWWRRWWTGVDTRSSDISPSDCAMRLFSSNLANCHATVQKLLIGQVLTKLMVWSWSLVGGNVSWTMCSQPWRDRVGSHCLRCHKQTDDGRVV